MVDRASAEHPGGRVKGNLESCYRRDMYMMEVKTPSESTGPFDLLMQLSVLLGDDAFLPLAQSACPLVKK
jgi:branched-chain amino acid transport system substrate-binding protein